MFNDDPFDSIVKEFFGENLRGRQNDSRQIIQGESDERVIDFVETKDKVFLVFELPGYSFEDVVVKVSKKEIEISVKKKMVEGIVPYLSQKLSRGQVIIKQLPSVVNHKKFGHTMKNGILEVVFNKK